MAITEQLDSNHEPEKSNLAFSGNEKIRVLLAEDSVVNQKVAQAMLEKLGLKVDIVTDGAQVIELLQCIDYDIVLMDIQMPVMDGVEAAKLIRSGRTADNNSNIPIIAMTANARKIDRQKCMNAGMNDYLTKPVKPETLAQKISEWLPCDEKTKPCELSNASENSNQTTTETIPVFDYDGFLERMMGDEELANEILETFLMDIPTQIEELVKMLEVDNMTEARRLSHGIKGASSNVGGERLRSVAFEIENAAKEGDSNTAKTHIGELRKEFEVLKNTSVTQLNLPANR